MTGGALCRHVTMLPQEEEAPMPVFVKMQNSKEVSVVTDGVNAEENGETLKVFDAKGKLVGRFHNVEQWYVGQARPNKE